MGATLSGTAERVLEVALARPGPPRLVCLDGPSGSGKTTLSSALVQVALARGHRVAVVHLDDLYAGWEGLPLAGATLSRDVVGPFLSGLPGRFARWDWHRQAYDGHMDVPAGDLLVVEGVGAGHPGFADRISALVWVDAPADLRQRRAVDRDGSVLTEHWEAWRAAEESLWAAERTRERADLVVDGRNGGVGDGPGQSTKVPQ